MSKRKQKQLKKQQSMTASQRKELRRENDPAFQPDAQPLTSEEYAAKKKTRNLILLIAIPLILVIIVTVSVIIPVWYRADYKHETTPIVEIQLSNDMTLRYKIYTEEAHNAATNFLFLSKIGYFDGNVIHDTQRYWVHFGGYYLDEDGEFQHKSKNEEFINKTSKYFSDNAGEKQFRYKINEDKGVGHDTSNSVYGLFGNFTNYCGEFEILGRANEDKFHANASGGRITFNPKHIGSAYDDETKNNIDAILGMNVSSKTYRNGYFKPSDPIITIKTVKVFNYAVPYGNNFEKYMTEKSAISSSWTGTYI